MYAAKDDNDQHDQTLTRLVNQYQGLLLRLCYLSLRDMELARDAVQDTFLKAYGALDGFRGECSEKNWLIHIALNTCRDMRRAAWFRHHDRRITPDDLPQPVCAAQEKELDILQEVLALPPKLREVTLLYYWQSMNVNEIAATLGIAHATVSDRLKRARKKLHDALKTEVQ